MSFVFGWKLSNCLLKDFLPYSLKSFADSNFAKDFGDYNLVIGYYFFLNKIVVSWYRKKQRTVSTSMTKTKYIALRYTAKKVIWIWWFIIKIKLKIIKCLILYGNNEMSIALIRNIESQYHTKDIDVQHHYIQKFVNKGVFTMK